MRVIKSNIFHDRQRSVKLLVSIVTVLSLSFSISFSASAVSGEKKSKDNKRGVEDCEVRNFGKIDDHVFRGGQPEEEEYEELADLGVKTVIDLRDDTKLRSRILSEKAGMKYFNLPLSSRRAPTGVETDRFLSLVNDQTNWPVFVHCAAGRHRTGALIAVYRMEKYNWNAREAYEEMKDYKFYSTFGHGVMKDYVFDYYRKLSLNRLQRSDTSRARQATNRGQ